jgi:hypothetical protein
MLRSSNAVVEGIGKVGSVLNPILRPLVKAWLYLCQFSKRQWRRLERGGSAKKRVQRDLVEHFVRNG